MNLTDRGGSVLSVKSRSLEETLCLNTFPLLIEIRRTRGAKNTWPLPVTVESAIDLHSLAFNSHAIYLFEDFSHSHD